MLGAGEWSVNAGDWHWLEHADQDYGRVRSPWLARALAATAGDEAGDEEHVSPHTVLDMLFPLVFLG